MTRNTPEMLPYCQHCGRFKGVGVCENPTCDKTNLIDLENLGQDFNNCIICSSEGEHSCFQCGGSYCEEHALGREYSKLVRLNQHLGTCAVCGKFICEQCWIFDSSGSITCLVHRELKDHE